MRNALIFILCLCWTVQAKAQTSIYDCGIYPPITQTLIENAGAEFNLPCVILNQNYDFNGGSKKIISSPTSIHVLPGFHAGAYNPFGAMHLRITPKAEFDVAVMNYGSLEHILRYEKFELGIGLPIVVSEKVHNFIAEVPASEQINPFLEWKIRVTATFIHPATGTKQVVDGFYTRELEREPVGNTWKDIGTNHPFRVRFAPPLNGEWKCKVNISLEGAPAYESSEFPIQVIESGNPGFTKVHPNKKNLMRGDEIIFPVGTNLPFDGGVGSEFMQWTFNTKHAKEYPMSFWKRYVDSVDSYGKKGGQFIRVINAPASSEIEFEKLGNYYDRLQFATEMDKLIEVCHTNGTLIDFCLMYHTPLMTSGDYKQWAWDYGDYWPPENDFPDPMPVYCYSSAFNSSVPHEMITNDEAFKYMKQRYRYYISRYGYSTNVYMFEIVNEPWHLDQHTANKYEPYKEPEGDIVRSAVTKMNTELSKYIKEHLHHREHLLAAVGYFTDKYPNGTPRLVNDESWFAENIDIMGMNHYESRPDKMIISKSHRPNIDDNNGFFAEENSYAHSFHKLFEIYDKPIILTEHGHSTGHDGCSNYLGNTIDPMRLGFTGIAGFNMWAGWDFIKNQSKLWPRVIRSQQHMNGADVIRTLSNENGGWLQGREIQKNKELVEHQYYISNNKESCVGYVYNRTCNVRSNGCPGYSDLLNGFKDPQTIYPNDHSMEIQGLKKNTDYMVDWYSYETGQYMSSECYNSSVRGRISLEHPNLPPWIPSNNPTYIEFPDLLPVFGYKESPLVWYVVKQQNCHGEKSMSQGNPETSNISESKEKDKLRVSPNPFNSELTIESDDEIGLITITDSQGTIVRKEHFFSNSAVISTSGLSSGVYFIYNQKVNNAHKIIKL